MPRGPVREKPPGNTKTVALGTTGNWIQRLRWQLVAPGCQMSPTKHRKGTQHVPGAKNSSVCPEHTMWGRRAAGREAGGYRAAHARRLTIYVKISGLHLELRREAGRGSAPAGLHSAGCWLHRGEMDPGGETLERANQTGGSCSRFLGGKGWCWSPGNSSGEDRC